MYCRIGGSKGKKGEGSRLPGLVRAVPGFWVRRFLPTALPGGGPAGPPPRRPVSDELRLRSSERSCVAVGLVPLGGPATQVLAGAGSRLPGGRPGV